MISLYEKPITMKDWFRSMRGIEARVRSKEAQRDRFRDLAMRAGVGSFEATRISGTSNRSRAESGVIESLDVEDRIREDIRAMLKAQEDVSFIIDQISDTRYRSVMDMYYMSGWTWMHIADEMRYDITWVQRLHGMALLEAKRILQQYPEIVHRNLLSDVL